MTIQRTTISDLGLKSDNNRTSTLHNVECAMIYTIQFAYAILWTKSIRFGQEIHDTLNVIFLHCII